MYKKSSLKLRSGSKGVINACSKKAKDSAFSNGALPMRERKGGNYKEEVLKEVLMREIHEKEDLFCEH